MYALSHSTVIASSLTRGNVIKEVNVVQVDGFLRRRPLTLRLLLGQEASLGLCEFGMHRGVAHWLTTAATTTSIAVVGVSGGAGMEGGRQKQTRSIAICAANGGESRRQTKTQRERK